MTTPIELNVNITETVGHLGVVTVDKEHLEAWLAEYEHPELSIGILSEYLNDANLQMRERYTEVEDSTWADLRVADHETATLKIAADPAPEAEGITRYYWDRPADGDDTNEPFGAQTARIIDLEAGGAIAYVHEDAAPSIVGALIAADPAKAVI